MNQFKPIFLGQVDPNSQFGSLQRAVNFQKCIRAGGKHNDLDDVGKDVYHHTFFEMLGTWSFGDYFKKDAVDYAWDILTNVYKLDPLRIYATYFEGNDQVPPDMEARDLWLQYLPPHHVIPCTAKDNFWEMGDTGPCGPCSEVHYDRIGNGRDASALVNADDPNVIEIWNIVFIQYNRESPTQLQSLPQKHIDTGMGLERLVSILQDKRSNYDIDCFQAIIKAIESMKPISGEGDPSSPMSPYTGKVGADDVANNFRDTAYRAIADHIRTLSFAIADGVVPNNEGRGYVLRRILRRAARYGQQKLGLSSGFLTDLVPCVIQTFGAAFPELIKQQATIQEIIAEEEESFRTMLSRGIKYFNELEAVIKSSGELDNRKSISGTDAFFLYDTLGFPIDLTEQMAEEARLEVDKSGFEQAMAAQKKRSRQAKKKSTNEVGESGIPDLELLAEQTSWLLDHQVLPTDDGFKYKTDVSLPATVMAIYSGANGFIVPENSHGSSNDGSTTSQSLEMNDYVGLVLDKSSFYAEAGGQVADTGTIEILDAQQVVIGTFEVRDVHVYAGFLVHEGVLQSEVSLQVGMHVNCRVNYDRRKRILPNHSLTHVLNSALREVLGDNVDQRGSLCNEEKLRFDFSHKKAMTVSELRQVESICQAVVSDGQPVTSSTMPLAQAQAINGVRAVFGEVYPDPVRVVTIGDSTSIEFCGGTHLSNTAEAQAFVLVEETAVAKGIRRITAITGSLARDALAAGASLEDKVAVLESLNAVEVIDLDKQAGALRKELDSALASAPLKAELRTRIEAVQQKANDSQKRLLQQRVDKCLVDVKVAVQNALEREERVLVLSVDIGADSKASQRILNIVKDLAPELAFMGISEESVGSGGKILAFAVVPPSLVMDGLKADDWIRKTLEECSGRGGGKPEVAQGQASQCDDVEELMRAALLFGTCHATSAAKAM
jgi:alanyl-tRNA synthetase